MSVVNIFCPFLMGKYEYTMWHQSKRTAFEGFRYTTGYRESYHLTKHPIGQLNMLLKNFFEVTVCSKTQHAMLGNSVVFRYLTI